jgi:hypothetical protein
MESNQKGIPERGSRKYPVLNYGYAGSQTLGLGVLVTAFGLGSIVGGWLQKTTDWYVLVWAQQHIGLRREVSFGARSFMILATTIIGCVTLGTVSYLRWRLYRRQVCRQGSIIPFITGIVSSYLVFKPPAIESFILGGQIGIGDKVGLLLSVVFPTFAALWYTRHSSLPTIRKENISGA